MSCTHNLLIVTSIGQDHCCQGKLCLCLCDGCSVVVVAATIAAEDDCKEADKVGESLSSLLPPPALQQQIGGQK